MEPEGRRTLVVAEEKAFEAAARGWAERLGAQLALAGEAPAAGEGAAPVELRIGPDGLALRTPDGTTVRAATERLTMPRRGKDLLGRAIGRGPGERGGEEVVDATAGLGADAFHLAASGFRVTLVERVPVVAALLEDALERARRGELGEAARIAAARAALEAGDARGLLARRRESGALPSVVLLDPMYPKRGKAALPGKGMALFRELVGDDQDAPALLEDALATATRRVVVKRPHNAPELGGIKPSGSLRGSTTRYDLYAPRPSERKLG